MKVEDIISGGSAYSCEFEVETMLDVHGRVPNLSDTPLRGMCKYKSSGWIVARDLDSRLLEVRDTESNQTFVVGFDDCWGITKA